MPTGPDGQKRSRNPIKAALQVTKIATGEQQEQPKSASRRRVLRAVRKPHSHPLPAPPKSDQHQPLTQAIQKRAFLPLIPPNTRQKFRILKEAVRIYQETRRSVC